MSWLALLAIRQLNSTRGLALVLGLGIVVAATLLASAPIYARSMADLGLTYTIREDLRGRETTRVEFAGIPLQAPEGVALREAIEQRIDERIGWFRVAQNRSIRLGHFAVLHEGEPERRAYPRGEPQAVEGYAEHVRVIEGELPGPSAGTLLDVAVSPGGANVANLRVGDVVLLQEEFDNCERELAPPDTPPPPPPPCPISERVLFTFQARITAIIEPLDPEEVFWGGQAGRLFNPFFANDTLEETGPQFVLFAHEETLLQNFGALFPSYRAYTTWNVTADPGILNRSNYLRARDDLNALYDEFQPLGGFAISPLRDVLTQYGRSADYQQVPLTVLLLEITGIALFYIALVAAIVIERQSGEIALLRGRGASVPQVLALYLVQGLVIGIPTLLLAPFLAGGMTALLGLTPLFDAVTGGDPLPVTIVPLSFALAGLGVLLSILAILLPALVAAIRDTAAVRRGLSRPASSLFQRYYLDLVLAGVAILLLVELRERGSVFEPSSTGGLSSDPLLLATPALAIAAAGALILRFYPLILRAVARLTAAVAGAAVTLALIQVVRNPGQYTRLALLLMMAVSVGTFAASYTRTADRSYVDRANHVAGVDLRAATQSSRISGSAATLEENAGAIEGVTRASALIRTTAALGTTGNAVGSYQVLALDPAAAREMLWFREDLADQPLDELLAHLEGLPALPGRVLPTDAETLSIWARADAPPQGFTLRAGIRDADGRYFRLPVMELEELTPEWTEFSVPLQTAFASRAPYTLVSLVFTGQAGLPTSIPAYFDDISATGPGGTVVVEDFEGAAEWSLFPSTAPVGDTYTPSSTNPHGGRTAVEMKFRGGSSDEQVRGIYLAGFLTPLPVITSESFLAATGLVRGSTVLLRLVDGTLVPVVIRETFELFPTTHSRAGPVIIFSRDRLESWRNMASSGFGAPVERNELWLGLAPDADLEQIAQTLSRRPFGLERTTARVTELAAARENPLIAASGSGILYAAFVAVLVLVAAALLTSLVATVRRRRLEFAVVQVIGLSRRQLLGMLAIEYALVFAVGVAAGCLMGLFVADRMLSFLDVTEAGERVEPSFILETRWLLVALGIAIVVAAFSAALWVAARAVRRGGEAQALRGD